MVLHEQLMENFPTSVYVSWSARQKPAVILSVLDKYVAAAKRWTSSISDIYAAQDITKPDTFNSNLETATQRFSEAVDWSKSSGTREDPLLYDTMKATVKRVADSLQPLLKPLLDHIVYALVVAADSANQKLLTQQLTPDKDDVRVSRESANFFRVQYRDDSIQVTRLHFKKLKALYAVHSKDHWSQFRYALYALLRRYTTFFGSGSTKGTREGITFHAAAPETVFTLLHKKFGVSFECFASPLNCFFPQFCSAFRDIDRFFGSHGSFFDWEPPKQGGSFEVGPPYTLGVMNSCAQRLLHFIALSEKQDSQTNSQPLTFFIFVPEWRNPPAQYHLDIEASLSLRYKFLAKGNQHSYVVGDQHASLERYFVIPFETRVYVLQNQEAWKQNPFTEDKGKELENALIFDRFEQSRNRQMPPKYGYRNQPPQKRLLVQHR